jgi:signal transduction histidine kinase
VSDAAERPTLADLRPIDLFDDLSDEELQRWVDAATVRDVPAGGLIAEKGDQSPGFKMVIAGTVQALLVEDGRVEPVGQHVGPTWMGAIPVLTETGAGARMLAETDCRVASIPNEQFVDLALSQRAVHRRIMRQVRPVVGRMAAVEQNRERLASLGTMAAGLAHELNNPAAAAKRAAADLADALEVLGSTIAKFVRAGVTREEAEQLVEMHEQALAEAAGRTALDALDSADAEDDLVDALDDLGVPDGWRVAEPLVAAGVDAPWLARVAELAGPATGDAVAWIAASLTARGLAAELNDSAERMSKLVGAVKSYAYMDRGEVVEADVHEGLETTLVVLAHKLKHSSIEVVRNYDRALPKLMVRGSELNQVWTNLIDNAIDALGDSGTITIATRLDGDCAVVEVADDGPGIPPDARERVFEPFFTTKGVGSGTGLGLDTARRIVEERHRGSLSFESEPGSTVFRVRLPLAKTAR